MEAERRASPATVDIYTRDLRDFERYITESEEATFDPAEVELNHIRAWIISLSEQKTAVGSINRKITTLRSFYRFLIREGIVEQNPVQKIKALKSGRKLPHFVDQERMRDLVRMWEEPSEVFETERNAMVILMLYACGLRRSELSSLNLENVNLPEKTVRVMGKGAKERMIPLLPEMARRLEHYLLLRSEENICEKDRKALFLTSRGTRLTDQGVYTIVRGYLSRTGVQGKQSPHVLRHTFATHLMQQGVSVRTVQQLLGHESLAATQVYTHNTIESLKEIYRKAHPRAQKK